MPAAPIAKGVIIMCAVLIAAGYTVYENREQVKELVDRTRRKISLAMHTFAEEIMPSEGPRQRHQPMAFSGRPLDASGHNIHRPNSRTRSRRNSTDSITLRGDDEKAEGSSRDAYLADSALRYRPPYRGSAEEPEPSSSLNARHPSATASPFDDENRILFDAAAEAADQHINEKILSSSPPGSDTSSDTLSPAMSEKGFPMSHDAPPMIPAVLPTTTETINVIDQPPPLPPRPSHPQYQETPALPVVPVVAPVALAPVMVALPPPPPPPPQTEEEPESDVDESHTTFSTSQPYWAIQQWTEDVTGHPNADEDDTAQPRTPAVVAEELSSSEVEDEDEDEEDEEEEEDRLAVRSLHSESEAVSMIGSDEGESEDDRVEFVSDLASSVGDTDGWSEVGSQFSEGEVRM